MDRPRYFRQLFFFLLAVLLPSAVLVAFGVLFLAQERQLAANRADEEQAASARDAGRLIEEALAGLADEASDSLAAGVDTLRSPAGSATTVFVPSA